MRPRAIPAHDYVRELAGLEPEHVACPSYADSTPSQQIYNDGSWFCIGSAKRTDPSMRTLIWGAIGPTSDRTRQVRRPLARMFPPQHRASG